MTKLTTVRNELIELFNKIKTQHLSENGFDYYRIRDSQLELMKQLVSELVQSVIPKQPELHELLLRAKQLMYCAGGTPIEISLNPMDAWLYDAECAAISPAQPVIPEKRDDLLLSFDAISRLNNAMYRWTSRMSYNGSYVGEPEGLLKGNIREIEHILDSLRGDFCSTAQPVSEPYKAVNDIIAERRRQISTEGWTVEHDDEHTEGEIASAAACYALFANDQGVSTPASWPWGKEWWKQAGQRRDLVKAGALILAEIERLDRAAPAQESE